MFNKEITKKLKELDLSVTKGELCYEVFYKSTYSDELELVCKVDSKVMIQTNRMIRIDFLEVILLIAKEWKNVK